MARYFPAGTSDAVPQFIRVNSTKHHNMYAAAERLIANTIRDINIPDIFTDVDGFAEGLSPTQPFEVPIPESLGVAEDSDAASAIKDALPGRKRDYPTYMGVVAVSPNSPAIDPVKFPATQFGGCG